VLGEDIPTCEFVSTRQTEPFPARQKDGKRRPAFLSVLDMDHDIDTWRCNGATNLRFTWPPLRRDNELYHAVLAMQENTFDKDTLRGWGEGRDGEIHYVDHMIKGLLSRWALWPMLTGYGRHLNAIRDSATLRSRSRHDAFKVLAALEDHVSYSIDIAAVTADLIPFAREPALFDHEAQSFEAARVDLYKNPNFTLIEGLRNWISKRAEWLQKTDLSVRDHLTQYGSLVGAKENVRVQRKLQNLTIVIVILTMVIVVLTLLTFWAALAGTEVAATINEFLNGVFSHSYPLLPAK